MSRDLEQRGKGKEYRPCKEAAELISMVDGCDSDVLSAKTKISTNAVCIPSGDPRFGVQATWHAACNPRSQGRAQK